MTNNQIFDAFIAQFTDFENNNSDINSLDMRYVFDLQKQRLEENNLKLKYTFQNPTLNNISNLEGWSDNNYQNLVAYKSFDIVKEFFINGKRKFKKKTKEFFYAVVTHLTNKQSDKPACCPNCGAIHSIKTLLHDGCPHCNTRFVMSDIFPKVTNYFTGKDYTKKPKNLKVKLVLFILAGIIVGTVIGIVSSFIIGISPDVLVDNKAFADLIISWFSSSVKGGVSGIIFWALSIIGPMFIDAVKAVPKLAIQHNAKNKIPEFMSKFDPKFSYQYFVGKAIALMRIMIFNPDYSNLAIYEGKETQNKYKNIVDVHFNGALKLNSCKQEGSYIHLDVTIHTISTYFVHNRIKEKNENFRMVLYKNAATPPDYGFTLKKVSCKSCGGSFDATRERKCPYCSNDYKLGEDDWVVLHFSKV